MFAGLNFTGTIDLNTIVLLLIGALTLINTVYSRQTEKNTNSMKDALVLATATSSHAAGREEARAEGEAKTAAKVEGILQGKEKP